MATEPMEYAKDVLVLLYNNPAYFLSFFDCIGNRGLFFQVLLFVVHVIRVNATQFATN